MIRVRGLVETKKKSSSQAFSVSAVGLRSWKHEDLSISESIEAALEVDCYAAVTERPSKFSVTMISKREFYAEAEDERALISYIVRRQRQKAGVSLRDLAERLGMKSKTNLVGYETGKVLPSIETLSQILSELGVEVEFVIGKKKK